MANYQTLSHLIISRGMDTRSALKNIKEGFASDIRNFNTRSAGFVEKRKGFQGVAGEVHQNLTDAGGVAQHYGDPCNGIMLFQNNGAIG